MFTFKAKNKFSTFNYLRAVYLTMNHFLATYIDFLQSLGVVIVIGFIAYSIKNILFKVEQRIEEVEIRVEK